jgi:hypothetical protein
MPLFSNSHTVNIKCNTVPDGKGCPLAQLNAVTAQTLYPDNRHIVITYLANEYLIVRTWNTTGRPVGRFVPAVTGEAKPCSVYWPVHNRNRGRLRIFSQA